MNVFRSTSPGVEGLYPVLTPSVYFVNKHVTSAPSATLESRCGKVVYPGGGDELGWTRFQRQCIRYTVTPRSVDRLWTSPRMFRPGGWLIAIYFHRGTPSFVSPVPCTTGTPPREPRYTVIPAESVVLCTVY